MIEKNNRVIFCTLFPNFSDVHMVKDVGMIPKIMSEMGYESWVFSRVKIDSSEVKIIKFKNIFELLAVFARKCSVIDVLNLYHLDLLNFFFIHLYRFYNKKGIVYLKLDMDYVNYQHLKNNIWIKKIIKKNIINSSNIVSVESRKIEECMKKLMPQKKFIFVPDGVNIEKKNIKRENVILTVGRLGTEQKNTEMLVEAFSELDFPDWRLCLVGKMEDDFKLWLNEYIGDNHKLRCRIEVLDNISDRDYLAEIYCKAHIFVLPSRWESFGIAMAEALRCGDYVLTTHEVPAAYDYILNEKIGKILNNVDKNVLREEISETINKKLYANHAYIEECVNKCFDWRLICGELDREIKKIIPEK